MTYSEDYHQVDIYIMIALTMYSIVQTTEKLRTDRIIERKYEVTLSFFTTVKTINFWDLQQSNAIPA